MSMKFRKQTIQQTDKIMLPNSVHNKAKYHTVGSQWYLRKGDGLRES
jgi:hypothetical protein